MPDLKIVYHGLGHNMGGCIIGQLVARENYVTNAAVRTIVVWLWTIAHEYASLEFKIGGL